MEFKYLLKIFIISLLILSVIFFLKYIGITFNQPDSKKKLLKVVTIERLENPISL